MTARRILFFLLTFFFSLQTVVTPLYAATESQMFRKTTNPDVADTPNARVQVLFIEMLSSGICFISGVDAIDPTRPCLGIDNLTKKIGYMPKQSGGAIGTLTNLITSTLILPISTTEYIAYLSQNFGLTKQVFAKIDTGNPDSPIPPPETGVGFVSLSPLMNLWLRIRDIAYLGFVLIFVLIGLGIMLRIKLDPRTVMTIQSQIPRIIVSILLITFSYAIAAFFIDSMWLTTYIGINVLTEVPACAADGNFPQRATQNLYSTPLYYLNAVFNNTGCSITEGIRDIAGKSGYAIGEMTTGILTSLIGGGSSTATCELGFSMDIFGACMQNMFSTVIGYIVAMIVGIAIVFQLIRVWFELIKCYVYVLLYVVVAPGWILLGLLPGNKFGFESWVRHLVAELAAFPVTVFFIVFAALIANNERANDAATSFVPPLIGTPTTEGTGLGYMAALGVILIIPEVANMMREAFKSSHSKYTAQIGAGMAAGAAFYNPMNKYLFGKNKAGQFGPATYYGRHYGGALLKKIPGVEGAKTWYEGLSFNKQPKQIQIVSNQPAGGNTGGNQGTGNNP